jgi:hypothetical protein
MPSGSPMLDEQLSCRQSLRSKLKLLLEQHLFAVSSPKVASVGWPGERKMWQKYHS